VRKISYHASWVFFIQRFDPRNVILENLQQQQLEDLKVAQQQQHRRQQQQSKSWREIK
jgi:hypothetical protein